ncbi:MAG: DHHA1 domain-containing protein, partial [Parachlamydiales bacterium]
QYRKAALKQTAKQLADNAEKAGAVSCVCTAANVDPDLLVDLAEETMQSLRSGVIVLAIKADQRCQLLVKVSSDLVQKGIQAVQLIKEIAPLVGGSGGGKADSAQAGGKSPEGLPQAFEKAKQWLANR